MLSIGPRWEYLSLERPEPIVHDVPIEWPSAAPATWVCPLTRYGDGEVRGARDTTGHTRSMCWRFRPRVSRCLRF